MLIQHNIPQSEDNPINNWLGEPGSEQRDALMKKHGVSIKRLIERIDELVQQLSGLEMLLEPYYREVLRLNKMRENLKAKELLAEVDAIPQVIELNQQLEGAQTQLDSALEELKRLVVPKDDWDITES